MLRRGICPFTPNRGSNARDAEMPEERKRRRGERGALHRNGAGQRSGTPTAGMGDQNRGCFPLTVMLKEKLCENKVGDSLELYGKYGGREE